MVILADAAVPFPQFFLFPEPSSVWKTEYGAVGRSSRKTPVLNRVMGMKRPDQFGIALAVGPGVFNLFPDLRVDFLRKNIFFN